MCRSRRVNHTYTRCGHVVYLPEEFIQCEGRWCKFSTTHPPPADCKDCMKTCWQYRQYPETYNVTYDKFCPNCAAQGHQ